MADPDNGNRSSVELLLQSFVRNVKHFHLPGLPSIGEISDISRNVTNTVHQGLAENFDRLPLFKQLSEISRNVTEDIHSNVKQFENGVSEFSKNITNEFQTNFGNFHMPNFQDLSQISQNVTVELQSNLKSMFSKNASGSIHTSLQGMARNVSVDITKRLRDVAEIPQILALSQMSKNITSNLGDFIFSEADKFSKYSKNVTDSFIFPTIEGLSRLSKNITDELEVNIKSMKLPDIKEMVQSVRNLTQFLEPPADLSIHQQISSGANTTATEKFEQEKLNPIKIIQDVFHNIISPLANVKKQLQDFNITSTDHNETLEDNGNQNAIDVSVNEVESEKPKLPSVTSIIVSSLKTLKTMVRNIVENQDKIGIAFKAIPTLMPYILEANTPSLHTFLKEGTQFSVKELYTIHSSLIDFHKFVNDTKNSMDKNKAPLIHNLALLIKQRNLGLLNVILQLMIRADKTKDSIIKISKEDIATVEKNIISPKEFYQVLFEPKNVKEPNYDRQLQRALL